MAYRATSGDPISPLALSFTGTQNMLILSQSPLGKTARLLTFQFSNSKSTGFEKLKAYFDKLDSGISPDL